MRNLEQSEEQAVINERLSKLMAERKMKQIDLVRISGASKGSVSKWLNGDVAPDGKYLVRLSEYFGVSVNYLLSGKEGTLGAEEGAITAYIPRRIPLISHVQAGSWTDTYCDASALHCDEWIETGAKVSNKAFALTVRGDSMTNLADPRNIQDGAKVVVEPEFDYDTINHKIVVAMLDGSAEATVKEFVQDGASKFLNPLNPRYPVMPINGNCRIIGIVKQIIIDL